MLVCNVSLRALRRAISAGIAEAAAAVDGATTGNVVFATLVDDPASVGDIVNAYLGEIMIEAASAAETLSAGSVFVAAVDEVMTATDTIGSTIGAFSTKSAMLPNVFINPGTSRDANANGIMVNQR